MEEDALLIPNGMTNDCIAQTWYRFLRTIGSPIALCSPQVISKTPQFMQWVVSRADGVETFHHPCLVMLPQIFLKAIKGISSQVDAFLGKNKKVEISAKCCKGCETFEGNSLCIKPFHKSKLIFIVLVIF